MQRKQLLIGLFMSLVLLEILTISTTDSFWPLVMLDHETLGLKILGWYLVIQTVLSCLALIVMNFIPEKSCLICNKDLKTFITVYGPPTVCPSCKNFFHQNCFRSKPRCPVCYPEDEVQEHNIHLDFTKDFPLS